MGLRLNNDGAVPLGQRIITTNSTGVTITTSLELERRSERMRVIEGDIGFRRARIEEDWRAIARDLKECFDDNLWMVGGWNGFDEWLDHVDISRSWGRSLVQIQHSPYVEMLERLTVSQARLAIRRLSTALNEAEAAAIVNTVASQPVGRVGWNGARQELYGDDSAHDIEWAVDCPCCGYGLLASKAVTLKERPIGWRPRGEANDRPVPTIPPPEARRQRTGHRTASPAPRQTRRTR